MRIFALELDNDIKGIGEREEYVEGCNVAPELSENPDLKL